MNKKRIIKPIMLLSTLLIFAAGCNSSISNDVNEKTSETSISKSTSNDLGGLKSTGMITSLASVNDSVFTNAIYASSSGKSTNSGTSSSPYDLETALSKVESGKSTAVLLLSGTYKFSKQLDITSSGTASSYKVLKASKGASVTLDFSSESYSTSSTDTNARGIQLNGSYWYIGGITVKGAADNGMMVSGHHNVVERCIFDSNRDTGLQISRSSSSVTKNNWPSYNYIINCTSKNNCDPATYENADGFASKLTCGEGNVFDGCISHNNSDDGWDLYAKAETGAIGKVTIRNCIAMRNGKTESGVSKSSCDGNGFKLGGGGVGTAHSITNSLAIENLYCGFTDNNNPSALSIANCTAFDNNKGGGKNNFSVYRCKDGIVSNSISYTTNNTTDKFVNLSADYSVYKVDSSWYYVKAQTALDTTNSSKRGTKTSSGITSTDFTSTKVPSVGTNFDSVWRNSNGSINTNGVGMLASTSSYASFSSGGNAIGARFSSSNAITTLTVNVK